jgi:TolA-binding protein
MRTRALGLLALWLALVGATPRPAEPPAPDLARLVPFANAPLDKPPLVVDLPLPPVPVALPTLPLVAVAPPAAAKPVAFIEAPRKLPCVGAWLGIATESLECGRARYQRGEYDEAAKALEPAVRRGTERGLLDEARYWLGETYWQLGTFEKADWLFRQVAEQSPRPDWGAWALHSSGWTALRLGQHARAREAFTQLLAGPNPAPVDAWGRHGLGLALMALGRYDEAEQTWTALAARPVPPAITRDVLFWHAEAAGRKGDAARAETLMRQFTQGGPHPLLLPGQLRLGWWTLTAGRPREAEAAFRVYLAQRTATERDWAEAGLALALLSGRDWAEAQQIVAGLVSRRSPLAQPMLFRVARAAVDAPADVESGPVFQQLLGTQLPASARAWVLLVKGESDRAHGNRDEARTQFELAQKADPGSAVARQAAVREALVNFELREFTQAVSQLTPVVNAKTPPDVRRPALLLHGESAYHAGDHVAAGAAFRRFLTEFPNDAQAPAARLGVAWALLRQGKKSDARRELLEFARVTPDHPQAPDGLVLASELALEAGDLTAGRELLERIVTAYPTHPRAEFARLNRGLLQLRAGDAAVATITLREWLARASFSALFGRAHAALGTALLEERHLDEAVREFSLAQKDGLTAFGHLGLGSVALARRRADDAEAAFRAARDAGTPAEVTAATYGLAAVAFQKGAVKEFKQPALTSLAAVTPGPSAARRAGALLYVLTTISVEEKDWPTALGYARRLTTDYAAYEATPDALERVGAGAAAAGAWPIAYESTILLRQRYPQSPLADDAALRLAEAQLETGRAADARRALEQFVASSPSDPRAGRAWIALARAREQSGDRGGALEAYAKAPRDPNGPEWNRQALFSHARLLLQDRRYEQARGVLDRVLKSSSDNAVVVDAAQAMGEAYSGDGDHLAAAEYYLTAAYVAPDTAAGRRGLLSAARALAAGKQDDAAATAYRKLLAQADVPADVRDVARKELAGLKRP